MTALILQTVTPLYQSEAILIVESPDGPEDDPAATVAKARENEIRVVTFLQLLQSRAMAGRVVHDLGLVDDREFNPGADPDKAPSPPSNLWELVKSYFTKTGVSGNTSAGTGIDAAPPPDPIASTPETLTEAVIDRLRANVRIDQINKSNMIQVTAYSRSPEKAQKIANKLATVSMRHQIEKRQSSTEELIVSLTKRVTDLRKQVLDADQRVAEYRKAHGITQGMQIQMDQLASELAGARAVAADAEARSSSRATGSGSPILADLQTQEITLQQKIAQLSALYGKGHPEMQNARAQLSQVQTRIAEELSQVTRGLQAETAARRSREAQLSGQMGALKAQVLEQGIQNVALMDLERDAETSRALYVSLLSRLKELQRQDNVGQSDADFVSRAAVPLSPSYPATKRILAVAIVAALIIAAILAFIAESMDGRIRSSEQMEVLTGFPALAMIPEIPENWEDLPPYVAIVERPCSAFSEAVRSAQQEIATKAREGASQIVVVTSPLPGEGKTTLSMSLAAAAAATNLEAVIVDLDLRRPGLQNMADQVASGHDLLDFIEGNCAANDILRYDPRVPKLAMIGVKHPAKDPGATLSSPRLQALLEELKQRYRFIVINTAPILPVRDAKMLASYADEVLMIARWSRTPPDAVRSARRILGRVLTGTLLNRVDYKKHAGLVYGDAIQHYSKYSQYYGETAAEEAAEEPRVPAWRQLFSGLRRKAA